ncbi:CheR family methyltransferase [Mesobacterium pallidum]|uniref:CheR family methyltransferase n=1 Tax=Mesobacterium pallidum TaxID=2872037 RepID=UPI001EE16728|nr:CheR family methyltransferase [Mesobacterium pallidum]
MSELMQADLRARFRETIYRETGIRMPDSKDHLIVSRLRKRLLETGYGTLDDYLRYLFEQGGMADEWENIVDLVTTNKTDFFRESRHFDILVSRVIPEALERVRPGAVARFRLWSAAASTGAEAYTAAMLLADAAFADRRLDWAVLGTDISTGVLEQAARAIYPASQLADVPAEMRARYLMRGKGPKGATRMRFAPEIRSRVRFAWLNLIDPPFDVARQLDAIFLRNVLIYFDAAEQARVVHNVAGHLRPGGWFFVGHAESMIVQEVGLEQVAPGAFRRRVTG